MDITNPYTFNIADKSLVLKITTLKVPNDAFTWPTSSDSFGRGLLAATYTITVPAGITHLKIDMGAVNGHYTANARIQNLDSKKFWFDNVNNDSITTPVIEVTPKKKYNLSIGALVPIKDNGKLQLLYSNDINKAKVDTSDL